MGGGVIGHCTVKRSSFFTFFSFSVILTSVSEEKGGGEWNYMCRFYFYELIWSVYSTYI
jgi:hypothetical protein